MKLATTALIAYLSFTPKAKSGWAGKEPCDNGGDSGCNNYCRTHWSQKGHCKKWWGGAGDWSKVMHCCCLNTSYGSQYRLSCPGWDGKNWSLPDDSYVPTKPVRVTFDVEVEHRRTYIASQRFHKTTYHKSKEFNRVMKSVSVTASGSYQASPVPGVPVGPQYSASLGVSHLKEVESQTEDEKLSIIEEGITYQTGKSQIQRTVKITTKMNGEFMVKTENQFVNADDDDNYFDLTKKSIDYLNERFVDNGNPRINSRYASFESTVYGCDSQNHILYNDRCYKTIDFSFRANNLHGYDGWFAPTPEPYLKITSSKPYWYFYDNVEHLTKRSEIYHDIWDWERIYNENEDPKYKHKLPIGNDLGPTIQVELKDNDDQGKDDLMCDGGVSSKLLLKVLAVNGEYEKKLDCKEGGEAYITFGLKSKV